MPDRERLGNIWCREIDDDRLPFARIAVAVRGVVCHFAENEVGEDRPIVLEIQIRSGCFSLSDRVRQFALKLARQVSRDLARALLQSSGQCETRKAKIGVDARFGRQDRHLSRFQPCLLRHNRRKLRNGSVDCVHLHNSILLYCRRCVKVRQFMRLFNQKIRQYSMVMDKYKNQGRYSRPLWESSHLTPLPLPLVPPPRHCHTVPTTTSLGKLV